MKCKNCMAPLSKDDAVCPDCGAPVKKQAAKGSSNGNLIFAVIMVLAAIIIFGLILSLTVFSSSRSSGTQSVSTLANGEGFSEGDTFPQDMEIALHQGGTFKVSDNEDKVILINLFATWCGPCVAELPDIQRLYEQYGDRVEFLVVDVAESSSERQSFMDENGYTFPLGYVSSYNLGSYSISFVPQTFVIDAGGKVSRYFEGGSDYNGFKQAIENALGQ